MLNFNRFLGLVLMVVISLFTSSAFAGTFSVEVGGGYSRVSGYMQTPADGRPGTADKSRPTFDELDIDESTIKEIRAAWEGETIIIYSSFNIMSMKSDGILKKDLMCRTQFLSGEPFDSKFHFNRYTIGAGYRWKEVLGFQVIPRLEWQFLSFGLELETPSAAMERSYMKATVRAGVDIYRPLKRNLTAYAKAMASLPFSKTPDNIDIVLGVKKVFDNNFTLSGEVRYERLNYEDRQPLPNHIRMVVEPALIVKTGFIF